MSEETVKVKLVSGEFECAVDVSVAELEKLGFTRTVVKPWKPVHGEACWYNSTDDVYSFTWCDAVLDKARWDMGNCYQTEAEATKARDKQLATVRVLRRLRELEGDWVADWSDDNQEKHHPCYNYSSRLMVVKRNYSNILAPPAWHSTEEAWAQVIKELEKDVKLMMGAE